MRYIPNSPEERQQMLAEIGLSSADELFRSIPADILLDRGLNVTKPLAENEVIEGMEGLAAQNTASVKTEGKVRSSLSLHYCHYVASMNDISITPGC